MAERERNAANLHAHQQIALLNVQTNFASTKLCSQFDPDMIYLDQQNLEYKLWLLGFGEVHDCMAALDFRETKKYKVLRQHVKGKAADLTFEETPTEDSYRRARRKLDQMYLAMAVRGIFDRLVNLPQMSNDALSVKYVSFEIDRLWGALQECQPTVEDMFFLMFI